jgi:hypothetical protein
MNEFMTCHRERPDDQRRGRLPLFDGRIFAMLVAVANVRLSPYNLKPSPYNLTPNP